MVIENSLVAIIKKNYKIVFVVSVLLHRKGFRMDLWSLGDR